MRKSSQLYLGLLSGTSIDGIDVGLFNIDQTISFLDGLTYSLPSDITEQLWQVIAQDDISNPIIKNIDQQLGHLFADAALQLMQRNKLTANDIIAIGSHGQNISHHPNDKIPYSLQIANAQLIANTTGITTVSNFRNADIAAGGQGAPLSPLLHQPLFALADQTRAIINIGGIANISMISANQPVSGYDIGPGNGLMDAWIKKHQQKNYDHNGQWANEGTVDQQLLQRLQADSYFNQPAPKSTGKEYFNLTWLQDYLAQQKPVDIQATLLELTATTIIQAITQHEANCDIIICGGGVHNHRLMQRLAELTTNPVNSSATLGIDPDYLEAMLFAWLAKCRLDNIKLDTSFITGARKKILLGDITTPI